MWDQASPPYSFGQAGATQPLAASFRMNSICSGQFSWLVGRTGPEPPSFGGASFRNSRTSARRALCSSENLNSISIPPCGAGAVAVGRLPQGKRDVAHGGGGIVRLGQTTNQREPNAGAISAWAEHLLRC